MEDKGILISVACDGIPLCDGDYGNRNLYSNLSSGIEACVRHWEKYAQQSTLNDPTPHKCVYRYENYIITIERTL